MTAAALVPLAFLSIMILIVVLAILGLAKAKRIEHDESEYRWSSWDDYVPPPLPPVASAEAPPEAEVIRMPVRLHLVKGGRG